MHIQRKWKVWLSIFLSLGLVVLSSGTARLSDETLVVAEETTKSLEPTGPRLERSLDHTIAYTIAVKKLKRKQKQLEMFYISVQHKEQRQQEEQKAAQKVEAASVSKSSYPTPQSTQPQQGVDWWKLAGCETGGKYDNPNTGNGYYGYFQFSLTTWRSVGGSGYPHEHSYEVQLQFAQKLAGVANPYSQWPVCWPRAIS